MERVETVIETGEKASLAREEECLNCWKGEKRLFCSQGVFHFVDRYHFQVYRFDLKNNCVHRQTLMIENNAETGVNPFEAGCQAFAPLAPIPVSHSVVMENCQLVIRCVNFVYFTTCARQ